MAISSGDDFLIEIPSLAIPDRLPRLATFHLKAAKIGGEATTEEKLLSLTQT